MIGKIIGWAVCFAAIASGAAAQEVGIELHGGLQGTQYPIQNGENKLLPGGSVGVNYLFKMSSQWGVLTGVEGGIYRTQASLSDGIFIYNRIDDAGSAFRYDVKIKGYKETQQLFAASIPLLLQYRTNWKGGQWYISAGGKAILPLNATSTVSAQQLSLTGYYPNYDIVVSNLPSHGFGTLTGYSGKATTQLKPAAALSAETGWSFAVSPGMRLYAGVYIDYGLTDLRRKSDSMPLVSYSAAGINKAEPNGVMKMRNTGAMKMAAFGLEVRLSFGGRRPARQKKDTALVTQGVPSVGAVQPAVQAQSAAAPKRVKGRRGKPQPAAVQPEPGVVQAPPAAVQPPAAVAQGQPATVQGEKPQSPAPKVALRRPSTPEISQREAEIVQRPVVFGAIGSADLPQDQKSNLDEVVAVMKEHPNVRISIVGHTCNDVKEKEDIKVGEARAKAVASYLQSKGINRKRMDVSYFRDSDQVQLYNPAVNARNRRVDIMVE